MNNRRRDFLKHVSLGSGAVLLSPMLRRIAAEAAGATSAELPQRFVFVVKSSGIIPAALVTGITIGWVPIEEYTFFVVQTIMIPVPGGTSTSTENAPSSPAVVVVTVAAPSRSTFTAETSTVAPGESITLDYTWYYDFRN